MAVKITSTRHSTSTFFSCLNPIRKLVRAIRDAVSSFFSFILPCLFSRKASKPLDPGRFSKQPAGPSIPSSVQKPGQPAAQPAPAPQPPAEKPAVAPVARPPEPPAPVSPIAGSAAANPPPPAEKPVAAPAASQPPVASAYVSPDTYRSYVKVDSEDFGDEKESSPSLVGIAEEFPKNATLTDQLLQSARIAKRDASQPQVFCSSPGLSLQLGDASGIYASCALLAYVEACINGNKEISQEGIDEIMKDLANAPKLSEPIDYKEVIETFDNFKVAPFSNFNKENFQQCHSAAFALLMRGIAQKENVPIVRILVFDQPLTRKPAIFSVLAKYNREDQSCIFYCIDPYQTDYSNVVSIQKIPSFSQLKDYITPCEYRVTRVL